MITPEEAIKRIGERFGVHPGYRALHAKGVICSGTFVATPEGAALTSAGHMQGGEVPVLARLSNGGGDPDEPDGAPDVRGLAVSFELPDGKRTDIVAQSGRKFPVKDPDSFIELVSATKREPASLLKLPWFLLRHPSVVPALVGDRGALKPVSSYADPVYYAIHAYRWTDDDGTGRWVRYSWLPAAGPASEPAEGAESYLVEEVEERLPERPIRFDLELQIAEEGDDPDDPTTLWPQSRRRVLAGTVTLEEVADGHDGIIFDPLRLTEGITPSQDPILHFRPKAYAASYDQRTGQTHQRPDWAR